MIFNQRYVAADTPRFVELTEAFAPRFRLHKKEVVRSLRPGREHVLDYTTGSLYDSDGNLVQLAERTGGYGGDKADGIDPFRLPKEAAGSLKRLEGTTAYLGYFMNHFGHFLTESLSRLWFFDQGRRFDRYVAFPYIFDNGVFERFPFHDHLLRCLGFDLDQVQILDEPVEFERVFVPEQLWTVNYATKSAARRVYRHIARRHQGRRAPERVFLSRLPQGLAGLKKVYTRIANLQEVEALFLRAGYAVVHPETLPIQDQLDIYVNTPVVVGLAGSSMHNCLFADETALWIDVGDIRTKTDHHVMQKIAYQLSGVKTGMIRYAGDADGGFDLDRLAKALDGYR